MQDTAVNLRVYGEFALDISSESVVVPEVPYVSKKKDYTIV